MKACAIVIPSTTRFSRSYQSTFLFLRMPVHVHTSNGDTVPLCIFVQLSVCPLKFCFAKRSGRRLSVCCDRIRMKLNCLLDKASYRTAGIGSSVEKTLVTVIRDSFTDSRSTATFKVNSHCKLWPIRGLVYSFVSLCGFRLYKFRGINR